MANKVIAAALLTFALCMSVPRGIVEACVDVSSHITCTQSPPASSWPWPAENYRVCHKTTVDDTCAPTTCTCTEIEITHQEIEFESMQTKIWSPGNLRGKNYQNKRLCRYNVACNESQLMYYSWVDGNFILEDEHATEGCLDYVKNDTVNSEHMCDNLTEHSGSTSVPMKVEFRSNTGNRYPGFQIDILCVDSEFNETESLALKGDQCQELMPTEQRRKREASTLSVSQTSNTIQVPREAYIEYQDNVLTIEVNGKVLRIIEKIRALFFWTGFKGTTTYRGEAPTRVVYGGGILRIIRNYAYYQNDKIPPELEPNDAERDVIAFLLNATAPFFVDQDIYEDYKPTEPPIFTKPIVDRVPIRPTEPTERTYATYQLDRRIDPMALEVAESFDDACNVFLRAASRSYLEILSNREIRPDKEGYSQKTV